MASSNGFISFSVLYGSLIQHIVQVVHLKRSEYAGHQIYDVLKADVPEKTFFKLDKTCSGNKCI